MAIPFTSQCRKVGVMIYYHLLLMQMPDTRRGELVRPGGCTGLFYKQLLNISGTPKVSSQAYSHYFSFSALPVFSQST